MQVKFAFKIRGSVEYINAQQHAFVDNGIAVFDSNVCELVFVKAHKNGTLDNIDILRMHKHAWVFCCFPLAAHRMYPSLCIKGDWLGITEWEISNGRMLTVWA